MMHNTKKMKIEVGYVTLIKVRENKGKRSIVIVEELLKGKDDAIHCVKLRTPRSHIEQPIQYFPSHEMHCDVKKSTTKFKNSSHKKLNVDLKEK